MQDEVFITILFSFAKVSLAGFKRDFAQASNVGKDRTRENRLNITLWQIPLYSRVFAISLAILVLETSTSCPKRCRCSASKSAGLTAPAVVTNGSVTKSSFKQHHHPDFFQVPNARIYI
jgi:hypothetical protein